LINIIKGIPAGTNCTIHGYPKPGSQGPSDWQLLLVVTVRGTVADIIRLPLGTIQDDLSGAGMKVKRGMVLEILEGCRDVLVPEI